MLNTRIRYSAAGLSSAPITKKHNRRPAQTVATRERDEIKEGANKRKREGMMGSQESVVLPCTRLMPRIRCRRLTASDVGSGRPCKCVRYVAKNIRVFSEAGIGEPVVLRRLYVKAKSMKQCWVDE